MDRQNQLIKAIQLAYKKGVAIDEIAMTFHLTEEEVSDYLDMEYVEEVKRGRKSTYQNVSSSNFKKIFHMHTHDFNVHQIEVKLGISNLAIRKILGLTIPKEKGQQNIQYRHDGMTVMKYKIVKTNQSEAVRIYYANGTTNQKRQFRNRTAELDALVKENAHYFLMKNDKSNLSGKELDYYEAVKSFYSREHLLNEKSLKESIYNSQSNERVDMIQNYTNLNNYLNLKKEERELLEKNVTKYLKKDKLEQFKKSILGYDYEFMKKMKRSKEINIKDLRESEEEFAKYNFDEVSNVFVPKTGITELEIGPNTYQLLKTHYQLQDNKKKAEQVMGICYADSPRVNESEVNNSELYEMIHWAADYIRNGDNDLYKRIIKDNRIFINGISNLREAQLRDKLRRLNTVRELVEETKKR